MEKLFDNESSLFQQNINNIIIDSPTKKIIEDLIRLNILRQVSKNENDLFLAELYNLVGIEKFADIIELMAGRKVQFPEPEFFKETIQIAVCYYYKYLKNKSWDDIDNLLSDDDLSHIKIGIKTNQLDQFIKEYRSRMVKDYVEP